MSMVLEDVIHPDQTCAVPGRKITDSLVLIRDAICFARDRNIRLLVLNLDFEKAFDRVSHQFLFQVLRKMGFPGRFLEWVGLLYRDISSRIMDQEEVSPVPGLTLGEAKQVWKNAAHPALQNKQKDLSWLAAHEILPVRAVMHSRCIGSNPNCPRPGCGEPETVRHVFWECSVARDLWGMIGPLKCPSLPAGAVHPLVYRLAVNGVGQGIEKLPAEEFAALWLTLNSIKAALWTARNLLVGKRVMVPLHAIYQLVTSLLQGAPSAAIRRRGPSPHAGGSGPPRPLAPVDAPPKRR
ncbi:hypothetical protein MHYP_G00148410 [Metynnis hypsauchen]